MKKKSQKGKESSSRELNEKEKLFVPEYLINLDPEEAALKAGYSKSVARTKAYLWVSKSKQNPKPHIRAAVAEALEQRVEKTKIDAAWVLKRAQLINDRCTQVVPVLERVDGAWQESGKFKFDSTGANKSLEIIGKHVDVQAFKEQVGLTGSIEVVKRDYSTAKD